jgi:hypothetical protein
MKRTSVFLFLALLLLLTTATVVLVAQQQTRSRPVSSGQYPQWEVKVLNPQEIAPGRFSQVRPYELDEMATEGWELVSMTTFVLRNEEHEGAKGGERPIVTQAYMSYAFKRLKRDQNR